jgi:hypothetical protein
MNKSEVIDILTKEMDTYKKVHDFDLDQLHKIRATDEDADWWVLQCRISAVRVNTLNDVIKLFR